MENDQEIATTCEALAPESGLEDSFINDNFTWIYDNKDTFMREGRSFATRIFRHCEDCPERMVILEELAALTKKAVELVKK